LVYNSLWVNLVEVVLDDDRFTSTSITNIEHSFLSSDVEIKKELLSCCISSWNDDVNIETIILLVEWSNFSVPMLPSLLDIEEVVKAHSLLWELDLGLALPGITPGELILIKRCTKGPHACE